jgi:response regulator NasT
MDLVEMLTEAGYEVIAQATNGEEAIALANEHKPDLAILDVQMPVLDGISAAEKIISIAPVLMLTAFSQRELVDRARDAGVMAYVVKPFTISDLVPAI